MKFLILACATTFAAFGRQVAGRQSDEWTNGSNISENRGMQEDEEDSWASLTDALSDIVETGFAVGMSVAILNQDGSIRYKHGFGEADQDSGRPYTTTTVQPIGSVSKTLLGVALGKAQELGLLSMDDAVNDYIPFKVTNPRFPDTDITFRHLATHTSSMSDTDFYERAYIFNGLIKPAVWRDLPPGEFRREIRALLRQYNRNRDMPLAKFLERIYVTCGRWYSPASFTRYAPGEGYEYSNNGAALASLGLEGALRKSDKVAAMTYREFVQTYILDPLEMMDSGWDMADYDAEDRAVLYPFGNTAIPTYTLITEADGGFVTNMDDFIKYWGAAMRGFMLQEDNILAASTWQTLLTEGLFWVPEYATPTSYGHDGGDPGLVTVALFDSTWELGFIAFSNSMDDEVLFQAVETMIMVATED